MNRKVRYIIQVPYGTKTEIANRLGIKKEYVCRALRYDSETAPSQIKIRELALQVFGGKIAKITT